MLAESHKMALQLLLSKKAKNLYALYDAAQDNSLLIDLQKNNIPHDCLFSGVKELTLRNVAPYLLSCHQFEQNTSDFVDNIWHRGVTMLVESAASVEQVKLQLKKNTFIKNSEGVECYFRYYDARAFSRFMRLATNEQLGNLFGNTVKTFYWLDSTTNGIVGLIKKPSSMIDRILKVHPDFDIEKLS